MSLHLQVIPSERPGHALIENWNPLGVIGNNHILFELLVTPGSRVSYLYFNTGIITNTQNIQSIQGSSLPSTSLWLFTVGTPPWPCPAATRWCGRAPPPLPSPPSPSPSKRRSLHLTSSPKVCCRCAGEEQPSWGGVHPLPGNSFYVLQF